MKKRGQVTLFVIIGTFLIIAIFILLFLTQSKLKEAGSTVDEITIGQTGERAYVLAQACVEHLSEEAVSTAARYGGYALNVNLNYYCSVLGNLNPSDYLVGATAQSPSSQTLRFSEGPVYFNYPSLNLLPTKDKVKTCLKDYLEDKLPDCLKFYDIKHQGWNINPPLIEPETIDVDMGDTVVITVTLPEIIFTRQKDSFTLEKKFTHNVPFNFNDFIGTTPELGYIQRIFRANSQKESIDSLLDEIDQKYAIISAHISVVTFIGTTPTHATVQLFKIGTPGSHIPFTFVLP